MHLDLTSPRIYVILAGLVLVVLGFYMALSRAEPSTLGFVPAAEVGSPFLFSFNTGETIVEAGSEVETKSPYWWLDSGGKLLIENGVGKTMQGEASSSDPWFAEYKNTNPDDTDNGVHPQNIFRLVTRSQWENFSEEARFKIVKDNFSSSSNRNASNGLLFFGRYKDSETLYYAGIRVDGTAVIKKKYEGTYYTMAQKKVFPGAYKGDVADKNLLPHNEWLGMRSDIKTNPDGTVALNLYIMREGVKGWTLLLSTFDDGISFDNTPAITGEGAAGIRTDFMDVEFEDFRLTAL